MTQKVDMAALMAAQDRQCATLGCPNTAVTTIEWSYPDARECPERDVVCLACSDEYLRRPALQARELTTGSTR